MRYETAADPCDEDEVLRALSEERPSSSAERFGADELHRLPPIYFIGDSRSIVFRNSVYVSPYTSRAYQLRSVFLRHLYAADFHSPQSGLNMALVNALAVDQTLLALDEGVRWLANRYDFEADSLGNHDEHDAATLILFCGANDARRLLDALGPDADIRAWDDRSSRYDDGTKPASLVFDAEDVYAQVLELLEPFALGVEALRVIGFNHIFVHGFPQGNRGERSRRFNGDPKSMRQYRQSAMMKARMLVDRAMQSIAQRTATRFIAGPVGPDGRLADELTWDDVHYGARGAREVVRSVVSVLEGVVE